MKGDKNMENSKVYLAKHSGKSEKGEWVAFDIVKEDKDGTHYRKRVFLSKEEKFIFRDIPDTIEE